MPVPINAPPSKSRINLQQLSAKLAQINLKEEPPTTPHPTNDPAMSPAQGPGQSESLTGFLKAMEEDSECLIDRRQWPTFEQEISSITAQLRPLHFLPIDQHYSLIRQQVSSETIDEPFSLIHSRIKELRVAVIGNVDAGKSTLLAVLSRGWLDDGRGSARVACARHDHERQTGRTSSVNQELLGFKIDGTCMYDKNTIEKGSVKSASISTSGNTTTNATMGSTANATSTNHLTHINHSHAAKVDWEAWIGRDSWKCVSLIDLAGHERYLKTTMFGLTGFCPDMAIFLVAANAGGLVGMSKEHLALIAALGLPLIVVVTKVDLAPEGVKAATLASLLKALKAAPCKKTPFLIRSPSDIAQMIQSGLFGSNAVAPVLEVSNVTGQGIDLLRLLLNLAPVPDSIKQKWSAAHNSPLEYQINETYTVPVVGTVVSGVMLAGHVKVGDPVLLGPLPSGSFLTTQIRGIQRKRVSLTEAFAGQGVSFALKKVRRSEVRYGMVLIAAGDKHVRVCREFTAQVMILYHSTTITPKYQAMLHCGSIRQTVQIVTLEIEDDGPEKKEVGRSGDRARIRFRFLKTPEIMQCGQKVLFREGRIRGIGRVIQLH